MDVIEGPKLWWIVFSLCIGLLLSSLESTIVATALVSIASDFNNYRQSNWVVIAYLLTYSSFLIIFARLSDITGRKSALLTSLCIFTLASLACGLAQTLTQLIVFRAFQGIGGSGIYALAMVLVAEITPKRHFGGVSGMINVVFVVASAIGPVIGGAITTTTSWRWCFYLNVPSGAMVILLIAFIFPKLETSGLITLKDSLRRVDWIGLFLCLAASIVIILPLQEGGNAFAWNGGPFIAMIAVGGLCWATFAGWEAWISRRPDERVHLPMVPSRAIIHRVVGACIVTSFFTGLAFTSTVVYLPQRFQAVNDLSPVKSGTNILPALLISALGATASGLVLSKKNVCSYFILSGNALQLVGLGLQSSLPTTAKVPAAAYGYQAVLGLGLGTTLSSSFILARIEARREHISAVVGTITQLRVFGGVIGVVISGVVQSSYLRHHLSQAVTPGTLHKVISSVASISKLPAGEAMAVRQVYGEAFNSQFRILMYIAAANAVVAFFTFRRHATGLRDPESSATQQNTVAENAVALEDGIGVSPHDESVTLGSIEQQRKT